MPTYWDSLNFQQVRAVMFKEESNMSFKNAVCSKQKIGLATKLNEYLSDNEKVEKKRSISYKE